MKNELILLSHVSRRTHLKAAKRILETAMAPLAKPPRVEFLMDYAQRLWVKPGRAAPFTVQEPEIRDDAE